MLARKIARSVHEAARDKARAIAKTDAYAVSCRERKKVEMLFAHLKRILRLGRLRLRGQTGAKDEFLLAATAQNLRKLAKLIPHPTRRRSSPHKALGSNPSALSPSRRPRAAWRKRGNIFATPYPGTDLEVAFGIECEVGSREKVPSVRSDLSIRFTCGSIPRSSTNHPTISAEP